MLRAMRTGFEKRRRPSHGLVPNGVALLLVERHPAHVGVQRDPGGVQPREVGRDDDRGTFALQEVLQPLKAHESADLVGGRRPERPVVDRGARQAHVDAAGELHALGFGELRKAEPQVRERHVTTLRDRHPKDGRRQAGEPFAHRHRKAAHAPHECDPEPGKEFVHRRSKPGGSRPGHPYSLLSSGRGCFA